MELATKPSTPGENSSGVAVSTEKALAVRVEQLEKMVEELKSRMPEDRARHRALAAGQDRVLRIRPQPRAHRLRDRQRGDRGPGCGLRVFLARRRAGRRGRRPGRDLSRGRRQTRDGQSGDRHSGRFGARRRDRAAVHRGRCRVMKRRPL